MLGRLASTAALLGRAATTQLGSAAHTQSCAQGPASFAVALANAGQQWLNGHQAFATNSHDIFNVHKETADNNEDTQFDFSPENYKLVSGRCA